MFSMRMGIGQTRQYSGGIDIEVWIRLCRRKAKCRYCSEPITSGQYMVVVKAYSKKKESWAYWLRFHTHCWIDQGISSLERQPKVETRGKKKLGTEYVKDTARFKVLARRAAVLQRIKKEMEKPKEEQSVDKIIHWGGMLLQLKEEIKPLGGVPKSWE